MTNPFARYTRWLHTQWPAGTVESAPRVNEDGSTEVPGLYVVGDLTGIPLLKFAAHSGARAVRRISADPSFTAGGDDGLLDLAIVGGGVSGFAAALEARKQGLRFELFEAAEPFSTIANFPKGKPIYTYPTGMTPDGEIRFAEGDSVKEDLLEDLRRQASSSGIEPTAARVERVNRRSGALELDIAGGQPVRARRVIVAIGRSGDFRRLGVPGEDLGKVSNRLHDPASFAGQRVLVVGGGDSALEAAIALAEAGAEVTLSYRKKELTRPKPENVGRLQALADGGRATLLLGSRLEEIGEEQVSVIDAAGERVVLPNDGVLALIGRDPPLGFFRRSGVAISGEWRLASWVGFLLFFAFCFWMYHWKKKYGWAFGDAVDPRQWWSRLSADPASLVGTLKISMSSPGFYYTAMYSLVILIFGVRRIRRRRTPYIKWQTISLMVIQWLPLFLLPQIILPYLGHNDAIGGGSWLTEQLFPECSYGHGREYWRAYGFILAWPLFFSNLFTGAPLTLWLIISLAQTFLIIPLIVWRWGKGAYCGWICSCGALAETLGDTHRHKMLHGPRWNRFNMLGQFFLAVALLALVLRVISWTSDSAVGEGAYNLILSGKGSFESWPAALRWLRVPLEYLNYYWFVDLLWAGVLGMGLYFHFSGRMWCRFACPLAALMHIYTRFSRFRILADKKRCISCNVCTTVCHQGIDIMGFANKGRPMEDPECVRCSACVQSCPTGVLTFGRIDPRTGATVGVDSLDASPVQMKERRGA